MNPVLGALVPLYRGLTRIKNAAYEGGFSETLRLPVPVISVGNLSMGGTGKTPVVIWLSRTVARSCPVPAEHDGSLPILQVHDDILPRGSARDGSLPRPPAREFRRPVIVTRSYRTPLREPCPVQLGRPDGARVFGDEAVELATRAGGLVYTGPVKWRTALRAYQDVKPDLILLDDGFQHRRLARDFDIVLIDATDERDTLFPAGRLREDFASLGRADAVLLTKVNWARPEFVERLRARVAAAVRPGAVVMDLHFGFRDEAAIAAAAFSRPVGLVSAVGRNEVLRTRLEAVLQRPLDLVLAERDHHPWSAKEAEALRAWWERHPDGIVFTTEKDETKLRPLLRDEKRLQTLRLEVDARGEESRLFAAIGSKLGGLHFAGVRPDLEAGPWP